MVRGIYETVSSRGRLLKCLRLLGKLCPLGGTLGLGSCDGCSILPCHPWPLQGQILPHPLQLSSCPQIPVQIHSRLVSGGVRIPSEGYVWCLAGMEWIVWRHAHGCCRQIPLQVGACPSRPVVHYRIV